MIHLRLVKLFEIRLRNISAREISLFRPRLAHIGIVMFYFLQNVIGKFSRGRYFSAIDRDKGCVCFIFFQIQNIIPRDIGGVRRFVIIKRPYAGICPDDIFGSGFGFEIFIHAVTKILSFLGGGFWQVVRILMRHIRCANQGKVLLIGNGKNDPLI